MTTIWPGEQPTLGARVVVRYRTGAVAESGRPELTDVIGQVREVDPESVCVERRGGDLVRVRAGDVVAWKVVPPQR